MEEIIGFCYKLLLIKITIIYIDFLGFIFRFMFVIYEVSYTQSTYPIFFGLGVPKTKLDVYRKVRFI